MKYSSAILLSIIGMVVMPLACVDVLGFTLPKTVEAGSAFSILSTGSGKATLYIVGPGQVLKRDVQRGGTTFFPVGTLYNAGRYIVILSGDSSTESDLLDVVPASLPMDLSFLARPSRLPVSLHDGITGAVYVFDAYHNLIVAPTTVLFELSNPSNAIQRRIVIARDGAAFTQMDSTAQQGVARFVARIGGVSTTRVVRQVPGDPCGLKMNARPEGLRIQVSTELVRDCNGNAVPDGTIVTFTEVYSGGQSTVDVPLKHGIAEVQMADHGGATISVACGVVLGNQILWKK